MLTVSLVEAEERKTLFPCRAADLHYHYGSSQNQNCFFLSIGHKGTVCFENQFFYGTVPGRWSWVQDKVRESDYKIMPAALWTLWRYHIRIQEWDSFIHSSLWIDVNGHSRSVFITRSKAKNNNQMELMLAEPWKMLDLSYHFKWETYPTVNFLQLCTFIHSFIHLLTRSLVTLP